MRRRRGGGFTLIEVLIAVGILASIVTLLWGSFNQTFRAKKVAEAKLSRYRAARVAMDRITRDVSMAYLSTNNVPGTEQNPRTLFEGNRRGDIDELRFSYFGHQRMYADAREADTAVVGYFGMRDPKDPRRLNLMRRETRRLQAERIDNISGETDLLCDDVIRLELSYYDHIKKDWVEAWHTAQADGTPNRLPTRVRVKLLIHDDQGEELGFMTESRIGMSQALDTGPQT